MYENDNINLDETMIKELCSKLTEDQLHKLEYYCERRSIIGNDPNIEEAIDACYTIITTKIMQNDDFVKMVHNDKIILQDIAIETQIALVNLFIELREIILNQTNIHTKH